MDFSIFTLAYGLYSTCTINHLFYVQFRHNNMLVALPPPLPSSNLGAIGVPGVVNDIIYVVVRAQGELRSVLAETAEIASVLEDQMEELQRRGWNEL